MMKHQAHDSDRGSEGHRPDNAHAERKGVGRAQEPRQSRTPKESGEEAARVALVTKRERETVALVAEGLRDREIAERLYISPVTVHHHLSSIYAKLGVSGRLKLVVYAYKHGLAQLP
jgi:DNA-binding NarL/FixJ family response regulator